MVDKLFHAVDFLSIFVGNTKYTNTCFTVFNKMLKKNCKNYISLVSCSWKKNLCIIRAENRLMLCAALNIKIAFPVRLIKWIVFPFFSYKCTLHMNPLCFGLVLTSFFSFVIVLDVVKYCRFPSPLLYSIPS